MFATMNAIEAECRANIHHEAHYFFYDWNGDHNMDHINLAFLYLNIANNDATYEDRLSIVRYFDGYMA